MPGLLHTVERQGRRLSQLVADLLLLTSLEQDTRAKPPPPCGLNDIVAGLTRELAELAATADIDGDDRPGNGDLVEYRCRLDQASH